SKLRIGLAEQTVLVAFAQAAAYSERPSDPPIKDDVKVIKQVYSVHTKYNTIVSALLSDGVLKLPVTCTFVPGVSIGPMLAKPTKGVRFSTNLQTGISPGSTSMTENVL
ncbi:hypothetical protein MKX01_016814, partial [Papaver californicum]